VSAISVCLWERLFERLSEPFESFWACEAWPPCEPAMWSEEYRDIYVRWATEIGYFYFWLPLSQVKKSLLRLYGHFRFCRLCWTLYLFQIVTNFCELYRLYSLFTNFCELYCLYSLFTNFCELYCSYSLFYKLLWAYLTAKDRYTGE